MTHFPCDIAMQASVESDIVSIIPSLNYLVSYIANIFHPKCTLAKKLEIYLM